MSKLIIPTLLAGLLAACAGGGYEVSAGYASAGPNLVEVSPGVWAVADLDQPVFYSGNNYWLYSNGGWYRSPYYTGGWTYAPRVPTAVLSIRNPYGYVHGRIRVENRPRYYHRYYGRHHGDVRVVRPPHPIGH